MKLPIQYALCWPAAARRAWRRSWIGAGRCDLRFEPPDFERFGALRLGLEAAAARRHGRGGPQRRQRGRRGRLPRRPAWPSTRSCPPAAASLNTITSTPTPRSTQVLAADRWARQEVSRWVVHLIAAWYMEPETWLAILEVAIGLGLVIFVHELGHFPVAKLCGVKCEKFYLGFDIAGLKLCKFRRGETEYGIGILPLGGYVKMLGQEDNPAKLREEIERAKQPASERVGRGPGPPRGAAEVGGRPAGAVQSPQLPGAERAAADGDHLRGRDDEPDLRLDHGGGRLPAGRAGAGPRRGPTSCRAKAPGRPTCDRATKSWKCAGQPVKHASSDMLEAVAMGDAQQGIPLVVRRPGEKEPLQVESQGDARPGASPASASASRTIATLNKKDSAAPCAAPRPPKAEPPLLRGDKLVQLDEQADPQLRGIPRLPGRPRRTSRCA